MNKQFGLQEKQELEELIKQDILSKWNSDKMSLEFFLDSYVSEDLIDYINATGLNLTFNVGYTTAEPTYDDFVVAVKIL